MSGHLITQLPLGRIETFDDNEIKHASDIADPPKYRMSVPEDLVESNLGMISCGTERPNGELDEVVTFGARMLERDGRPAFVVAAARKGHPVQELFIVTLDGVYANVEIKAPIRPPASLRAPGGQTELHCQGDGNAVMYDVRPFVTLNGQPPPPFTPGVALATFKDGKIRDFREDGQYVG